MVNGEQKRLGNDEIIPTGVLEAMAVEYELLGYAGEVADIESEIERRYCAQNNI